MEAIANDPIGHLDSVGQTASGTIVVNGWAADPHAPGLPLQSTPMWWTERDSELLGQ